ncbi:MAG TPA: hypothetical protein VK483_11590 [Chitinophagaceae bacterium]|nr:hypothetical protein [Chitinophagaceae bacterium]
MRKLHLDEKKSLLILGWICIIVALGLLLADFIKPVIKKRSDLLFIKGPLQEYNLTNKYVRSGKSSIRKMEFTFRLANHSNEFRVMDRLEKVVKKAAFKKLFHGDTLTIGILKTREKLLDKGKDELKVYSIDGTAETFLDLNDVVRIYNGPFYKIRAGIFLLAAVIAFWYRKKRYSIKRK